MLKFEAATFELYSFLKQVELIVDAHKMHYSYAFDGYKVSERIDINEIHDLKHIASDCFKCYGKYYEPFNNNLYLDEEQKFAIYIEESQDIHKLYYQYSIKIHAESKEKLEELIKKYSEILKSNEYSSSDEDGKVEFNIWYYSNGRAISNTQKLACPSWEEISNNYSKTITNSLDNIHSLVELEKRGKIILWHGVPGTGKTHVVRSLSRAFSKNWSINLITDPETFLNDPSYMISLTNNYSSYDLDLDDDNNQKRGALLIFEDAPSFVLKSAREFNSNGMSRLLNMTDGILGQGLNIVMLLTTNHPKVDIDEAFLRPGRLIQEIEFKPLSFEESSKWLKTNGYDGEINKKEYSLAELYAIKSGSFDMAPSIVKSHVKMGF